MGNRNCKTTQNKNITIKHIFKPVLTWKVLEVMKRRKSGLTRTQRVRIVGRKKG